MDGRDEFVEKIQQYAAGSKKEEQHVAQPGGDVMDETVYESRLDATLKGLQDLVKEQQAALLQVYT